MRLGDDVTHKAVLDVHNEGVAAAMEYLNDLAGDTRSIHKNITGKKDLVRLPGLITVAYQHETSRAGDPHIHTHVAVAQQTTPSRRHIGWGRQ